LASSAAASARSGIRTKLAGVRLLWVVAPVALTLALVAFAVAPRMTSLRGLSAQTRLGPAVPLTSYRGIECCPSFSPDGTRVAFTWDGPNQDNFDIYIKLIGPGDPLRVTRNAATDCFPAWSPDGRWIAFLREVSDKEFAILLIPALAGGAEREVARVHAANGSDILGHELTWSKDGRFLFTIEKQEANPTSGIVRISVESGEKRPITIPPAGIQGDSSPSVSPDGRTLAFRRVVSGHSISDIHIVRVADDQPPRFPEPRRVTFDGKWIDGYAWLNSREVLVLSDRSGRTEPWRISVFDRHGPVRLTGAAEYSGYPLSPLLQSLAISPETHRLVYMQANSSSWDIWRMPISGNKAGKATSLIGSTLGECSPEYSPDGKRIALHSNRSGRAQIWICDADGSKLLRVDLI
jgi:Tol biopolymer transport system component